MSEKFKTHCSDNVKNKKMLFALAKTSHCFYVLKDGIFQHAQP
jgi:hypothetical protein